jgi:hypothetical protein
LKHAQALRVYVQFQSHLINRYLVALDVVEHADLSSYGATDLGHRRLIFHPFDHWCIELNERSSSGLRIVIWIRVHAEPIPTRPPAGIKWHMPGRYRDTAPFSTRYFKGIAQKAATRIKHREAQAARPAIPVPAKNPI